MLWCPRKQSSIEKEERRLKKTEVLSNWQKIVWLMFAFQEEDEDEKKRQRVRGRRKSRYWSGSKNLGLLQELKLSVLEYGFRER